MTKQKFIATLTLGVCLAFSSSFASGKNSKWSYSGIKGPEYWGNIDKLYHMCKKGKNQSPIDITSTIESNLKPIIFSSIATSSNIINNGHTVQVNVPKLNSIIIDEITYDLLQFHFHSPSENRINGINYPVEVHLVHADKNGNLVVIGIMFKAGSKNEAIQKLWNQMPTHVGDKHNLEAEIKPYNLLPKSKEYYKFNGSLTTPPCSEGVKWLVMKDSIEMSKTQISQFEAILSEKNNRPLQPKNARVILH